MKSLSLGRAMKEFQFDKSFILSKINPAASEEQIFNKKNKIQPSTIKGLRADVVCCYGSECRRRGFLKRCLEPCPPLPFSLLKNFGF